MTVGGEYTPLVLLFSSLNLIFEKLLYWQGKNFLKTAAWIKLFVWTARNADKTCHDSLINCLVIPNIFAAQSMAWH